MKKTLKSTMLAILCLVSYAGFAATDGTPLWMRYPNISPNGEQIAFAYKGDIYTVPVKGGQARQLTTGETYESQPIWSNDSKTIAFVSDRFGGMDIFTVPATGGQAKRITTHSGTETPLAFSPDNKEIYFSASIQDPASSVLWASWMQEIYKVSVDGGRPYQVVASPICSISFDTDGKSFLYYDRTGSENIWRKHHVSSVARNIFYYDAKTGKHTQLTTNPGEDRDPIFTGKDKMVFLSERNGGSFNVYESSLNDTENAKALTNFKKHPVRFLSRAANGTLCFGFQGEIYTLAQGGKPAKVAVSILNDKVEQPELLKLAGAGQFDMTADGKQLVLISRGEVFATTDKYSTTKQITKTAETESGATISPDGKTIVYASEKTGVWNLYKATHSADEPNFANATVITEEPLFKDNIIERTNPTFSPDGKELAFIEDRQFLKVLDLKTNKVRSITDASQHYGHSEGGFSYDWSPDGKWFAISFVTNRRYPYNDIGIVSAKTGGKIYNVTNSGYIDGSPKWVMDGNAIIFSSNRVGMRSHASWGSQDDIFIAFMNQHTMDTFNMSEEDYALYKEAMKARKDTVRKEVIVELDGLEDRVQRLTPMSSSLSSAAMTKDGETLYFLSAFENRYDLWKLKTRTKEVSLLKKMNTSGASLKFDKSEKHLYILGSRPQILTVASGQTKPISFNISMELDRAKEREYMFTHVVKQEEKKFYVKDYHGVDLQALKKDYWPFLAHINNYYDYAEFLSEYLGELNVSHTGSKYQGVPAQKTTPEFGLLFDMKYKGDGLKVDLVLKGGPFGGSLSKVKAGTILKAIDGVEIKAGEDYFPIINGKAGKMTMFTFYNPATKEQWVERNKPITRSAQSNLIYKRWVETRAAEVERLSGGRLGYVHIRSMNDGSYRDVYADVLGKYNLKDGIVIDTRFNGGGRLHEEIEVLFTGEKYLEQVIRGKIACEMPSRRWNKHSIMVTGEANYSNAHGTPWVYKHMGVGSIVGMPVPGTMTTVNWETLQERSVNFGTPVVGYRMQNGKYLENTQLEPDFLVKNKAHDAIEGRDEQIEVAVKELLKQIDADKNRW